MNVERQLLIEWGVPIAATILFVLAVAGVGMRYNSDGLSETGGLVLVGVLVAFIVGMAFVGILLGGNEGEDDEADD